MILIPRITRDHPHERRLHQGRRQRVQRRQSVGPADLAAPQSDYAVGPRVAEGVMSMGAGHLRLKPVLTGGGALGDVSRGSAMETLAIYPNPLI